MAHGGRIVEAMDATHPCSAVTWQEFEMCPEIRVLGLRKVMIARHEMIAPELDVWLERRELRPLPPIYREPRCEDQAIECKPTARRIEHHAATAHHRGAHGAARDDRKVLVPAAAEHRVARRGHTLIVDVVHNLPLLRISQAV